MLFEHTRVPQRIRLQWYLVAPAITLSALIFLAPFSHCANAQEKAPSASTAVSSTTPATMPTVAAIKIATSTPCAPIDAPKIPSAEVLKLSSELKTNQAASSITGSPTVNSADAAKLTAPCAVVPPVVEKIVAHIAVFLPLSNKAFSTVAEAVKSGFVNAAATDGAAALAYRIYAVDNEGDSLAAAYHKAAAEGAIVAVAALTRDGATRIAKEGGSLPTLALNAPAPDVGTPKLFYYLSLGVDAEARQAAQLAITDGFTSVIVVSNNAALAKRIRESFEREFVKLGREVKTTITLSGDSQDSTRLRQNTERIPLDPATDMFFLALDANTARSMRPYLPAGIPVYSTSMAFDAGAGQVANLDLESVRLLEMPWGVQPDHPAVMIYAKPDQNFSAEQARLYALGVDAWRLASLLATTHAAAAAQTGVNRVERQLAPIDGVTGKLSFDITTRQFVRTLTAIELRNGKPYLYRGSE